MMTGLLRSKDIYVSGGGKLDNLWKDLIQFPIKQDIKQQTDRLTLNAITQIILVIKCI